MLEGPESKLLTTLKSLGGTAGFTQWWKESGLQRSTFARWIRTLEKEGIVTPKRVSARGDVRVVYSLPEFLKTLDMPKTDLNVEFVRDLKHEFVEERDFFEKGKTSIENYAALIAGYLYDALAAVNETQVEALVQAVKKPKASRRILLKFFGPALGSALHDLLNEMRSRKRALGKAVDVISLTGASRYNAGHRALVTLLREELRAPTFSPKRD